MPSVDLKRVHKDRYSPKTEPEFIELPAWPYLMVDGGGPPDPDQNPAYLHAIEALYPIAYAVRAAIKQQAGTAYVVMPLEGLWWADDMSAFTDDDRDAWKWTLMIALPPEATDDVVAPIIAETTARRSLQVAVRRQVLEEGNVAQVMHLGPFSEEAATITLLHDFIAAHGYQLRGYHHEIYLSDPRRGDPSKMRTVIRQPVGGSNHS